MTLYPAISLAPMKCLVLKQPQAWLVAIGLKTLETRVWKTAYRGPLAIAAGKSYDHAYSDWVTRRGIQFPARAQLVYGAIVSTHVLRDVFPYAESHVPQGLVPFTPGERRYAFDLVDRVMLERPVPLRGRLGLFDLPSIPLQLETPTHGVDRISS